MLILLLSHFYGIGLRMANAFKSNSSTFLTLSENENRACNFHRRPSCDGGLHPFGLTHRRLNRCLIKTFMWPSKSTVKNVQSVNRWRQSFKRPQIIFKVKVVFGTNCPHSHFISVLRLSIIPAGFGLIFSTGQLLWPK